mmetsp:Transcript_3406/g.13547  ORF Transcript_3406/g.13547 Transcript_3406/m.13547 type:complete len:317 (-) Transcript_3406:807-1757(-)
MAASESNAEERWFLSQKPKRDERFHAVPTRDTVAAELARLLADVEKKEPTYAALLFPSERPPDDELYLGRLSNALAQKADNNVARLELFPLSTSAETYSTFKVTRDVLDAEDLTAKVKEHEAELERQAAAATRKRNAPQEQRTQGPGNSRMSLIMGRGSSGQSKARKGEEPDESMDRDKKKRTKRVKRDPESEARERLQRKKMAKELSGKLRPIIDTLWDMDSDQLGNPFRMVIDRATMCAVGVPDYFHFVTKPMNLSWMRDKAQRREYTYLEEFEDDLELMVENARKYNGEHHAIYKFGQEMLSKYDSMKAASAS